MHTRHLWHIIQIIACNFILSIVLAVLKLVFISCINLIFTSTFVVKCEQLK